MQRQILAGISVHIIRQMEQNRNSFVVERRYKVYVKSKKCTTGSHGIAEGKSLRYFKWFSEQILPFNIQKPEINEKWD